MCHHKTTNELDTTKNKILTLVSCVLKGVFSLKLIYWMPEKSKILQPKIDTKKYYPNNYDKSFLKTY